MYFILWFGIALVSSLVLTYIVRQYAQRMHIVDTPNKERKIHHTPTPLLGGLAPFVAFWITIVLIIYTTDLLPERYIAPEFLWGIGIAGLAIMVGGYIDDALQLSARWLLIAPIIATLVVIGSGIGIDFVSNPFGDGLWYLNNLQWDIAVFGNRTLTFVLIADVFTFVWLMGMMFTTKLLDGLDGLVSGMSAIGSFIVFALSLTDKTFQPDVALLAIVLAGAMLGFLFWNAHPAKIFLGEGGSVWVGFMLGMLAIISGGKVATALLIMGIPILDVGWVIIRRVIKDHRSPALGDNKHLHFRLLTAGLSQRQSVVLLWSLSALFGIASLFVQTQGKVYLLIALVFVMFVLGLWVTKKTPSSQSDASSHSLDS